MGDNVLPEAGVYASVGFADVDNFADIREDVDSRLGFTQIAKLIHGGADNLFRRSDFRLRPNLRR